MARSEGSAEPSMLLIRNRARPIHTHLPQWENVNCAPDFQRCCGIGLLRTTGGVVRVAFTRCAVHAGRGDRIEGGQLLAIRGAIQDAQ
jgi:hypothetical protein